MAKKYIKYSLLAILLVIIGVIVYWYYNPTIDDKDFDLEFRVSNEGKGFYKERNKKIEWKRFTYNDERYFNDVDKNELIIHSLDIIKGKEKIIIVYDSLKTNNDFKIANITYKDETGKYSPLIIKHKNDSIFIIQIGVTNNHLMFKGKKKYSMYKK
ncbi:hypothetical protein JSO56_05770 [Riemerella anatipestifer]|uniref:hypothetical protein n=1 Tax=Riemerella anatipestifer TaxID=34085 RepID=UPI0030C61677